MEMRERKSELVLNKEMMGVDNEIIRGGGRGLIST